MDGRVSLDKVDRVAIDAGGSSGGVVIISWRRLLICSSRLSHAEGQIEIRWMDFPRLPKPARTCSNVLAKVYMG